MAPLWFYETEKFLEVMFDSIISVTIQYLDLNLRQKFKQIYIVHHQEPKRCLVLTT